MRTGGRILVACGMLFACAARAEERLVLEPYPGPPWRVVLDQQSGPRFIREQLPEGQTLQDFHDSITAQSVPGYQGTPADFVSNAIFAQFGQNCDAVETVGPTTAEEQGRQVAYGQLLCGRQKGAAFGVHMFIKAIQGTDGLYVVDRDFRTPGADHPGAPVFASSKDAVAFLEAEGTATRYLNQKVYLCDPVFPEPRCAAPAP